MRYFSPGGRGGAQHRNKRAKPESESLVSSLAMRTSAWQLAGALVCLASGAAADVSPTERALARELFEQGRALMARHEYEQACPKLAESQRLDPAAGTLLNLAVCHEAEGKTATAWSEFNDALTLARRDGRADRVELATKRLQKLEPRLSRLTIVVDGSARLEGLEVRLDGSRVGDAVWGTPVPVDPGTHRIEATAPGRRRWKSEITVAKDADRKSVRIPELELLPIVASPAAVEARRPDEKDSGADSQRAVGYVVGGFGLVSIGIGSYFGLRSFSRWEDRNEHCTAAGCDRTGVEAGEDAERAALFSNLGIGLGVVAAGVGAYLVLTAGSGAGESTASVLPTPDGRGSLLRYRARF
jgi:hypothetical protein